VKKEKRTRLASCNWKQKPMLDTALKEIYLKKSLYLKKLKSVLFTKSTLVFISTNI